jgi:hypothetical protein
MQVDNSSSIDPCLACELDRVFSEAYSGNRVPLSPASFLHAWWSMAGGDLGGGCKQQDAHEFFLFMLQMVSSVNGSGIGNTNDGILSKLFDGSIRSDVVCCACCAASTTIDHFTNLSLDIPPPTRLLPPPIVPRPKAQATNAKSGSGAAVAKAGKQLVGAAKAAHLAKLHRQSSGKGIAALMQQPEPTPELSSQVFVDLTMEESMASELTSGGGGGNGAAGAGAGATPTSDVKNKTAFNNRSGRGGVSPATEGMNAPQPEQGSGINALGDTILGGAGGGDGEQDTLSSPQRKRAAAAAAAAASAANVKSGSMPPRSSSSPSADGIDPQQIQAAAAVAAAAGGPGALAHPALAQYLHWPGESLIGCLRRFVWPEKLGATGRWRCSECGSQDGALKQLSLAKLPPILVLHAKRFEHAGGTRATAKKLDTYLSFPLEDLDMAPYLTAEALKSRHVARPTPPASAPTDKASTAAAAAEKVEAAPVTATMSTPAPVAAAGAGAGGGSSRGLRSRPVSTVGGDSTVRRTRSAATAAATAAATGAGIEKSTGGGGGRTRSTAMTRSASAAAAMGNAVLDGINSGDASGSAGGHLPSPSSIALPSTTHNNNNNNDKNAPPTPTSTFTYDLFAVVCHRGTFQGGHYVSYVRANDGKWYLCDDAYVQRVSEEVVRTSQAYMLFYGQKGLLPWNSASSRAAVAR